MSDSALSRHQNGLWAESCRVLKLNKVPLAIYVTSMVLIAIIAEYLEVSRYGLWIGEIYAAALLAMPAHMTVLRNISGMAALNQKTVSAGYDGFVWRGIGLSLFAVLPSLFVTLFVLSTLKNLGWAIAVLAPVIPLLSFSAVFGMWGTMLPASTVGADRSFVKAGERGNVTLRYTFPRLIVSLGFLTVLQAVLLALVFMVWPGSGSLFGVDGRLHLITALAVAVSHAVGGFGVAMTAVILSRAFLMAEAKTSLLQE